MIRVIIINSIFGHLIGDETVLSNFEMNSSGHLIASTDIIHPEDNSTFLWVNVLCDTNCTMKMLFDYKILTINI